MIRQKLEIDGQTVTGWVEKIGSVLWVNIAGETFTYEPPRKNRERSTKSGGSGDIVAPMPGKVIKMNVAQGQKVASGDVLVVLEAMKMEYTLKAQSSGQVLSVNALAGSQVEMGQILVHVQALTE